MRRLHLLGCLTILLRWGVGLAFLKRRFFKFASLPFFFMLSCVKEEAFKALEICEGLSDETASQLLTFFFWLEEKNAFLCKVEGRVRSVFDVDCLVVAQQI